MGDDNRHEMMESLFGAESGESDEEPEPKPSDSNNSNSATSVNSARDDEEGEGEGGGNVEVESDLDGGESERGGSEGGRELESEAERGGTSDRDEASDREVEEGEPSVSDSETSQRDRAAEYEENEVEQTREPSEQGDYEQGDDEQGENEQGDDEQADDDQAQDEQVDDEQQASGGVAEARDVFGDSDEDDEEADRQRSKSREGSPLGSPERVQSDDERSDHPDELTKGDDAGHYESEEDQQAERKREKPVGPPLDIEVPLKPPPGRADQLNLVRVSNIMGIESKPFDPKTYVEESTFVTDAEGRKQRLRLEENVARWRVVRSRDGSTNYESNARFVKWSDGSMQLLLGNEVLDLSVQEARHDQSHMFIRHPKSVLQSQGRLLRKMKFMPSSLSSKSHKLLTALVDSRNKKVLKVKSVVTNMDPDKEKEGQEKAVEQRIRSKSDLQRKQDKITRKYSHMPTRDRDAQLSPGYLEGALEEEEEADDYERGGRRAMDARRFQQQLDAERGAEKRILNAKRQLPPARKPPVKDRRPVPSRREMLEDASEEEREESEYETEAEDDEEVAMDDDERNFDEEEEEDNRRYSDKEKSKDHGEERRRNDRDDDDRKRRRDMSEEHELSPPRKSTQRRRVVVSDSDEDE